MPWTLLSNPVVNFTWGSIDPNSSENWTGDQYYGSYAALGLQHNPPYVFFQNGCAAPGTVPPSGGTPGGDSTTISTHFHWDGSNWHIYTYITDKGPYSDHGGGYLKGINNLFYDSQLSLTG